MCLQLGELPFGKIKKKKKLGLLLQVAKQAQVRPGVIWPRYGVLIIIHFMNFIKGIAIDPML